MDTMLAGMGLISVISIIIGIVLSILWTMLPFAVFGIKNRLDTLIDKLDLLNKKVTAIEKELSNLNDNFCEKNNNTNKNTPDENQLSQENYEKYMPKS